MNPVFNQTTEGQLPAPSNWKSLWKWLFGLLAKCTATQWRNWDSDWQISHLTEEASVWQLWAVELRTALGKMCNGWGQKVPNNFRQLLHFWWWVKIWNVPILLGLCVPWIMRPESECINSQLPSLLWICFHACRWEELWFVKYQYSVSCSVPKGGVGWHKHFQVSRFRGKTTTTIYSNGLCGNFSGNSYFCCLILWLHRMVVIKRAFCLNSWWVEQSGPANYLPASKTHFSALYFSSQIRSGGDGGRNVLPFSIPANIFVFCIQVLHCSPHMELVFLPVTFSLCFVLIFFYNSSTIPIFYVPLLWVT